MGGNGHNVSFDGRLFIAARNGWEATLLRPERIGCVLTENWQIDPEQSTSAIIVHHPEAKYFNV